jgi:hypothetical protein
MEKGEIVETTFIKSLNFEHGHLPRAVKSDRQRQPKRITINIIATTVLPKAKYAT